MIKGIVKWFNTEKGYGFITSESGEDIFVHYSNIYSYGDNKYLTLETGQTVWFDLQRDRFPWTLDRGYRQAVNVHTDPLLVLVKETLADISKESSTPLQNSPQNTAKR